MRSKKTAIAVILTIGLVAFLLTQIPIADIPAILGGINPFYMLGGFVLYTGSYLFRALRFRVLLSHQIGINDLFSIACVHNMANSILPARTGELSYIYFVKKIHNIPAGEGIATMVVARIFDFITISGVFFISALLVAELPAVISNAFSGIAILAILLMFLLVLLVYRGQGLMGKIEWITIKLNLNNSRIAGFLLKKGDEATASFDAIHSRKIILSSFALSVLIWGSNYLMTYILVSEMGINISVWGILLGATFTVFLNLVPIPSISGLGAHEGIWTLAFMALGVSKWLAISSGFGYHILIIIYYMVLGCYGLIAMRLRGTRSNSVTS